jgi:Enoyl-(Acyl carrier protein) reductase
VTWCSLQHMARGGGRHIVNVSSRGAFRGEPSQPAYAASRAGIIAFGRSLARAPGPHRIAVTSVAPGFTETEMAAEELAGKKGNQRRSESPQGRVATAKEVAAAVVFLASPDAVMASGSVLDFNGASYLRENDDLRWPHRRTQPAEVSSSGGADSPCATRLLVQRWRRRRPGGANEPRRGCSGTFAAPSTRTPFR